MQIENIYWKLDLVMLERAGFSNCSYTTTLHNSRILHVVVEKKNPQCNHVQYKSSVYNFMKLLNELKKPSGFLVKLSIFLCDFDMEILYSNEILR